MRKIFTLSAILTLLLASCNDARTPQVVYDDTISDTLTIESVLEDTTKILVAGMPIHLDSTEVLIHPIGWEDIFLIDKYGSRLGSLKKAERVSSSSQYLSTDGSNYISGSMINLIFEDIKSGEKRKLTERVLVIHDVRYLRDVAQKTDKHYLLYSVIDKDYNRDGKLDGLDMTSYYMSNLDGTNFTKITKDYHYFDTDQLILKNNKYYFRTLEDVNQDGAFNKKDKYHYYYIDLSKDGFKPVEYFPLELISVE